MSGAYCPRCGRYQMPGVVVCAECGSSMYRPRWIAHPPAPYTSNRPPAVAPYAGPPSYRQRHPSWGFPPVIWQRPTVPARFVPSAPRNPLLFGIVLSVLAAVACLAAAGSELFRFLLIVRGRTEVLPASQVRLSDSLVQASGVVALLLGVAAGVSVLSVLGQLSVFGAARARVLEPRTSSSRLGRLLIPGFNLYGAGQVIAETDVLLRRGRVDDLPAGRIRPSRLVTLWWGAWVINGLLTVALIWRSTAAGLQAMADSVELHIAIDLAGALVAGLTAAVLVGFRRQLGEPAPILGKWIVAPPVRARVLVGAGAGAGAGPGAGPNPSEDDSEPDPSPEGAESPPADDVGGADDSDPDGGAEPAVAVPVSLVKAD